MTRFIRGDVIYNSHDPLDRGLVLEWRFDRPRGILIPDHAGRGHDIFGSNQATINGEWATTQYGPGWQFAAGEDSECNVTIQDLGIPDVWSAITMEVFFRVDALSAKFNRRGAFSFVQTNAAVSIFRAGYLWRGDGVDGRNYALVTGGVQNSVNGTKTRPVAGGCIHAILTYDGAFLRGYREGVADGSVAATGTIDDSAFGGDDELSVGGDDGANGHGLTILHERIYDRALTPNEIRARYEVCLKRMHTFGGMRAFSEGFVTAAVVRQPRYGFTNFQVPGIV